MRQLIHQFLVDESGPTAVEYAVLLALIVLACVGSVNALATATGDSFNSSASQLAGAFGS
jgi:pilus assembly protein Flp/PilA